LALAFGQVAAKVTADAVNDFPDAAGGDGSTVQAFEGYKF
jgi:hypothetical protein